MSAFLLKSCRESASGLTRGFSVWVRHFYCHFSHDIPREKMWMEGLVRSEVRGQRSPPAVLVIFTLTFWLTLGIRTMEQLSSFFLRKYEIYLFLSGMIIQKSCYLWALWELTSTLCCTQGRKWFIYKMDFLPGEKLTFVILLFSRTERFTMPCSSSHLWVKVQPQMSSLGYLLACVSR